MILNNRDILFIVLGKDMADSLGLRLNDSVTLVLPEATPSPAGVVPRFKRFKVSPMNQPYLYQAQYQIHPF
jgi:ABC-type lipoprotein release transport system permease subunit